MVAYADATQLIPDEVSYDQATPIFCAGYTVYSGLRLANPKPHECIAVVGIGALGHLGIQYSKAAGFETIAVTNKTSDSKSAAYCSLVCMSSDFDQFYMSVTVKDKR